MRADIREEERQTGSERGCSENWDGMIRARSRAYCEARSNSMGAIVQRRRIDRQYDRLCVAGFADTRAHPNCRIGAAQRTHVEIQTPPIGARDLLAEPPPYCDAKRNYRDPHCRPE